MVSNDHIAGGGYGSIAKAELDGSNDEGRRIPEADGAPFRRRLGCIAAATLPFLFLFLVTIPRRRNRVVVIVEGNTPTSSRFASVPRYYTDQLIDHSNPEAGTFSQKYYDQIQYFGGPGYPIFLILGGEDPLESILYPFVSEVLAQKYSAYTMTVEHRFFGDSWPVPYDNVTNADLRQLLTPEQALKDFVRVIQHKQREMGCGPRGFSNYCPVMTVGSSYPGFLSALLRLQYPDIVDIGYAGSAPLNLYSHSVDSNAYYDKVTQVAEHAMPGCANAVRSSLQQVRRNIRSQREQISFNEMAANLGICNGTVPTYIESQDVFSEELMMIIATHFANANMDYYPPNNVDTDLIRACAIFQNDTLSSSDRVGAFLKLTAGGGDDAECFEMWTEVTPGPFGRISASDWSGVGGEAAGWMWDVLSCLLQPEVGMSSASMFPPRQWTKAWLDSHCKRRFGFVPVLDALNDQYHFTELTNVTRLLLTNGMNDGWSVASILVVPPHSMVEVINFPNGAHHSDLTHQGPSDADTNDIKVGHVQIATLIGKWLHEVRIV